MGLINKIFGSYSDRQLKKIEKFVDYIESLAPKYAEMSNEELSNTTNVLKERLANGETLEDIMADAFAAIREADDRILGKRPFRVQLIGGIILHQGRIAEMKTGEGKTLVATMPAYLNALSGKGVHVVTVNDYLARRDSEEMGRVYEFMGLTTGLVVHGISPEELGGFFHDAGQPTVHFNVLEYGNEDSRRIIVDERAPLYHIGVDEKYSPMLIIVSDYDRQNRFEQTMLVVSTLEHFGHTENVELKVMKRTHCAYCREDAVDKDGNNQFGLLVANYINSFN